MCMALAMSAGSGVLICYGHKWRDSGDLESSNGAGSGPLMSHKAMRSVDSHLSLERAMFDTLPSCGLQLIASTT